MDPENKEYTFFSHIHNMVIKVPYIMPQKVYNLVHLFENNCKIVVRKRSGDNEHRILEATLWSNTAVMHAEGKNFQFLQ